MRIREFGYVTLVVSVVAAGASAGEKVEPRPAERLNLLRLVPKHTKARPLPGLPKHDYQSGSTVGPVTTASALGLLLESTLPEPPPTGSTPRPRERVRYFQLEQSKIQLDHCFLTRVVLVVRDNGEWTLTLRADQNPWMRGPQHDVAMASNQSGVQGLEFPQTEKATNGLKRNQFVVRVRFVADAKLKDPLPGVVAGKPVLASLPAQEFWVQRGQPFDFRATCLSQDLYQNFDLIDRVEIDFSYR